MSGVKKRNSEMIDFVSDLVFIFNFYLHCNFMINVFPIDCRNGVILNIYYNYK